MSYTIRPIYQYPPPPARARATSTNLILGETAFDDITRLDHVDVAFSGGGGFFPGRMDVSPSTRVGNGNHVGFPGTGDTGVRHLLLAELVVDRRLTSPPSFGGVRAPTPPKIDSEE